MIKTVKAISSWRDENPDDWSWAMGDGEVLADSRLLLEETDAMREAGDLKHHETLYEITFGPEREVLEWHAARVGATITWADEEAA